MPKQSAGLLLYRLQADIYEVLLVHPGGPFWARKDMGAWSIPKGEFQSDEDPLSAAKREFQEETGSPAPEGVYLGLAKVKQSSGKIVHAWAVEADFDLKNFTSNTFDMEWPPKSGQTQQFPEADKAAWFPLATAQIKLVKGQVPLLEQLATQLKIDIATQVAPAASKPPKKKAQQVEDRQASLFD